MKEENIVLATNNLDKVREINQLLHDSTYRIIPQSKFNVVEVEETGSTFIENALIKARNAAKYTNIPVIADDSGIEVVALDGRPGIFSARYAGAGATDEDNLKKLIKDKLIILDKKNKLYALNTDIIEQKILNVQIDNLSKFLSKFTLFFLKNKLLIKEVKREQIKKDVEDKFLLYLTNFLDFQIGYFSKMKTLMDIESIFILLLCTLNTTSQIKTKEDPMSSKVIFSKLHALNKTFGFLIITRKSHLK